MTEAGSISGEFHHSIFLFSTVPPGGAVDITCVLDLLLLVAVSVYHISPLQLTSLMLAKLLAQNTVDTLAYRSVHTYATIHVSPLQLTSLMLTKLL